MACLPPAPAALPRLLAAVVAIVGLLLCTPRAHAAEPEQLDVPGSAPAWYFAPKNKKARMAVVWMHGRGGNPHDDCKKWANVAVKFGWLLCPSGQEDYGNGGRAWNNDWPGAQRQVDNALDALRKRFPTIQRYGHVLIGFSEGAYAAQNIGVREPRVFNRWLILASAARYWGGEGLEVLKNNRAAVKRVYLLTGALDGVVDESKQAYETLKKNRVHTRLRIVHDMGHEVPAARMHELYSQPLQWLVNNR